MQKALVLVRNPVSRDGRVLREAHVLDDLGFDVLVAGVVSGQERQTELDLDGIRVVRLVGPRQLVNGLLRRRGPNGDQDPAAGGERSEPTAGKASHFRRLLVTLAFNVQGIALVWRTSPVLVHANDYDTMWIGVAAKLLRRSRIVYDAHELWPDQGQGGVRSWMVACELLFAHAADGAVAANAAISETMAKRYRVPAPVVVRNVPAHVAQSPAPPEGLRAEAQPLVVYIGTIAPERGIEHAIKALALVPGIRLRLMGDGDAAYLAQLEQGAAEAGVRDRIEYRPPVQPAAVADTIAAADMGLVLTEPTCLNNVLSLPNKLFEYTAAGLPVIASDLPLLGPLVREEGIGEVVLPTDIEGIAVAMRRLGDPVCNEEVRAQVQVFAERTTWAQERLLLEGVYASVLGEEHDGRA